VESGHSGGFRPFRWILVPFRWIPVPFLRTLFHSCGFSPNSSPIPAESTGMTGFLQESVGHQKVLRHHAIGSGSGSGAGGVRCHSTEGVAEESRDGGSGSERRARVGSGSGRRAGVGSGRGSPYRFRDFSARWHVSLKFCASIGSICFLTSSTDFPHNVNT